MKKMEIAFKALLVVMGLYEKKLIELMGLDNYKIFAQKCDSEGYREVIKLTKKELYGERK